MNQITLKFFAFSNLVRREMMKNGHCQCFTDISMPTAKFLAFLFENQDTDIFQKDIEEFFSLRPSTVSRSLKLLEEKGYIIRTSMDYDSRLKKITLAEKSKEVCRSFEMSMRAVFEEVTKNISEQDIDNFNLTLSKMIANLDK